MANSTNTAFFLESLHMGVSARRPARGKTVSHISNCPRHPRSSRTCASRTAAPPTGKLFLTLKTATGTPAPHAHVRHDSPARQRKNCFSHE